MARPMMNRPTCRSQDIVEIWDAITKEVDKMNGQTYLLKIANDNKTKLLEPIRY